MQVFVRVRPPFQDEIDDTVFDPTLASPGKIVHGHQNSTQWQCTFTDSSRPQFIELSVPKEVVKDFRFDQVFADTTGQGEIFQRTCQPLVDSVLQGYNGTYFVYG